MKAACNHLSNPVFIASFVLSLGTYMPSFVEICHNWFVSHNSNTFYLSKNIFKVYMYLWYDSHTLKCHLSYNLPDHLWDTVKAYELVKWVIKYWVTTSPTSQSCSRPWYVLLLLKYILIFSNLFCTRFLIMTRQIQYNLKVLQINLKFTYYYWRAFYNKSILRALTSNIILLNAIKCF